MEGKSSDRGAASKPSGGTGGRPIDNFEFMGRLGRGNFGVVYKVKRKVDAKEYVLKKIILQGMSLEEQRDACAEAQILAKLRNPYVVRYRESFLHDSALHSE